jgi:hypothetical protein
MSPGATPRSWLRISIAWITPGLALSALLWAGLIASALAQDEHNPKPPFITTPLNVAERMLALAGTKSGDIVVDLGSGDGRIVISAAAKFGARGVGLELDAALVEKSRAAAREAGVADRTEFRVADVLKADFRNASVVTAYLLPWLLEKLGSTLLYDLQPGTRIVTHAFRLAGWQPERSETVVVTAPDPKAGAETTIHLWIVPAKARGDWITKTAGPKGTGRTLALQIHQNFQELDVTGTTPEGVRFAGAGSIDGVNMTFSGAGANRKISFSGRIEGEEILGTLITDQGSPLPMALRRR